jgi:hypothetical protein
LKDSLVLSFLPCINYQEEEPIAMLLQNGDHVSYSPIQRESEISLPARIILAGKKTVINAIFHLLFI